MRKIAAYLEDVNEDPIVAIHHLKDKGINNIAIKNIYRQNIKHINDEVSKNIKIALNKLNMNVVLLASDIGYVEAFTMDEVERLFNLAAYFKSPYIRFGLHYHRERLLKVVNDLSLQYSIVPTFETSKDVKPDEIEKIIHKNKKWKIIYDPAQIILRTNIDPHVVYYQKIRSNVIIIDIHDFKIGHGHKPAGFGDGNLKKTLSDRSYYGWYIIEPNLGSKYGSAITKQQTFDLALESALNLFDSLQT